MTDPDLALAGFSKLWWGNALRLRAAAWINDQPTGAVFFQRQMARELATEAAYVRRELDLLLTAGAIEAQPQEAGVRRQLYTAVADHPIWVVVEAAQACAAELDLTS
jgi:hypothetical protein